MKAEFKSDLRTLVAPFVVALLPDGRPSPNVRPAPTLPRAPVPDTPVVSRDGTPLPPYNRTYLFDQLIDHKNPGLGTFKQRFWHTWEFYEPGGPIILMTPGESNAQGFVGYLTNTTINGMLAQQEHGATIVLEHRFFGLSNPKPDLTDESLKLHTIEQAIEDLEYFARNVKLPMPGGDNVSPGKTPWIMIGGSYPGALTAYTMVAKPGLFFAGYSSSGVVETILDYWKYFEPIRNHMPRNCSADVQAVIAHVDEVFSGDNTTAIDEIKAMFGMSDVKHLNDVSGALRNNLWDWQALQITSGPNSAFYRFCDALEVQGGVSAPESGWGLEHALSAWGAYWRNGFLRKICGNQGADECLTTYDPNSSWWTSTGIDYTWRSWWWIVCNEVGYFQNGPPSGHPAIVSRLVSVIDDYRQCHFMFPKHFPEPPETVDVEQINLSYGGWDVRVDRLFFANGMRDPWLDATMSAPGLEVESTEMQPIALSEGFHCSDLSARSAVNPTIAAVQKQALASMKKWLATFDPNAEEDEKVVSAKIEPTVDDRVIPERVVETPPNAWFKDAGSF